MKNMKSCYVLITETNIKNAMDPDEGTPERTTRVFEDFEAAKKAMRTTLKEFSYTDNGLFDGNGNVVGFEEDWIEVFEEYAYDEDKEKIFNATPGMLRAYFSGEEVTFDETFLKKFEDKEFDLSEDFNGWLSYDKIDTDRGVLPFGWPDDYHWMLIQINSFCMDDPDNVYICRIRSSCDEWDLPKYLYLELRKIEIE